MKSDGDLRGGAWGRGMRIATASVRTGFAMTVFCKKCGGTGRRRHRPPRMVARSACVRADVGIGPYGLFTDRIS